jgi:hypothetical protein
MNIKTLIKLIFFVIIIGIIIYVRTTKIPVLCLACEETGTFTRCITGTGNGTQTCDGYKLQKTVIDNINRVYTDIENTVSNAMDPLNDAYAAIQSAKKNLTDAFANIDSINIPSIPSFTIPKIGNISCAIDFGGIPNIDICKSGLTPAINQGTINPINTALDGLESQINSVVGQLNSTITPINSSLKTVTNSLNDVVGGVNNSINKINDALNIDIPTIKQVNIPTINSNIENLSIPNLDPVNFSCNLDIAKLIKDKLGSTTLDVCSLLIDQINNGLIPQLNIAFEVVEKGINIAIQNINSGIIIAINSIKSGITTAILMLEQQLNSLNIFGKLTNKISDLVSKIESLNPIGLIKLYVIPYISAIFPFATLADILTFLIFLVLIPFIIPVFLIINSIINLIPDIEIF